MTKIDEDIDLASTMGYDRPTQFSLRFLLLLVLVVAVWLALFQIVPLVPILLTAVVLLIALGRQRHFWPRFGVAFATMVGVNLLPWYFTWEAFRFDGYECVGWPFTFFKRGGFSYSESFYPQFLFANVLIAVGAAFVVAKALKDGWVAFFRRLQTWGIEDAT